MFLSGDHGFQELEGREIASTGPGFDEAGEFAGVSYAGTNYPVRPGGGENDLSLFAFLVIESTWMDVLRSPLFRTWSTDTHGKATCDYGVAIMTLSRASPAGFLTATIGPFYTDR